MLWNIAIYLLYSLNRNVMVSFPHQTRPSVLYCSSPPEPLGTTKSILLSPNKDPCPLQCDEWGKKWKLKRVFENSFLKNQIICDYLIIKKFAYADYYMVDLLKTLLWQICTIKNFYKNKWKGSYMLFEMF